MNNKTVKTLYDHGDFVSALKLSGRLLRDLAPKWDSSNLRHRHCHLMHLEILKRITLEEFEESLEPDVLILSVFPETSYEGIYTLLSNYVAKKYKLDELSSFNPNHFVADPLVVFVLEKTRVMNVFLENALIATRKQLLRHFCNSHRFDVIQMRFCLALVSQLYENEYIYIVSKEELKLIDQLSAHVIKLQEESAWTPSDLTEYLITLLLFMSLDDLIFKNKKLSSFSNEQWPKALAKFYEYDVTDRNVELDLIEALNSEMDDQHQVTHKVRSQYEENPYPRWKFQRALKEYSFSEYLIHNVGEATDIKNSYSKTPQVLVAGCGTGRQAIEVATQLPCAEIFAVDISLTSLGYAARKARELGLKNLEFRHANILQLEKFDRQFDLIACCGVLHHMQDPLQGWRVLTNILASDGFMNIALYSAKAREGINQHRNYIKQLGLSPTFDNIRNYRASTINTKQCGALVSFYDFWNTSECRDLLFHVQEHQFSWLSINDALDDLGLSLRSVSVPEREMQIFKSLFKAQNSELNLRCWHDYENARPKTFASMFNFWCSKN